MIIPSSDPFREEKVFSIRDACLGSLTERQELYSRRKKYFMFGTDNYMDVKYNRIMSHLDLVQSFLYSPDHATYNLSPPINSDLIVNIQSIVLQDRWNQVFRDSGLAYQYGMGLMWSLVFDSMFLKVGWHDERDRLAGRLVMPSAFGVYDETEPDLDAQEAFVHIYRLPYDNAVLRLLRAGLKDRIKDLGIKIGTPIDDMPPVLKQLLITATGGQNLSGNLMGQAPLDIQPAVRYEAKSLIPTIEFEELWVWDDIAEDYATFIIAEPDILISDSRQTVAKRRDALPKKARFSSESNEFLHQEHPFIEIKPYPLPDYYWGDSHEEKLIPLQVWSNERLDQIAEILELQVDPSKVFSGFMGLQDEKAEALGGPGTWVTDSLPGAKVETLRPQMPEDLFHEYSMIGQIFMEASGLTETVAGHGEKNVRSGGHSKQLAVTGSGRIRKVAVGLEPSLVQCGDIGLKLFMRNSTDELNLPENKGKFYPSQYAPDEWQLRIAGHSHSPLFIDEGRDLAATLLKARAIDREMFVRLLNPPQKDTIIELLRVRLKLEMEMAKRNPPPQKPAGGGKARGKEADHGP